MVQCLIFYHASRHHSCGSYVIRYFFGFFHFGKRTSTGVYHVVAEAIADRSDATTLYVDAGGSSGAAYVRAITFTKADGSTNRRDAADIRVLHKHFQPWTKSGIVVDGMLKLRLGSKTDIAIPAGARSAVVHIIDNPDPTVHMHASPAAGAAGA